MPRSPIGHPFTNSSCLHLNWPSLHRSITIFSRAMFLMDRTFLQEGHPVPATLGLHSPQTEWPLEHIQICLRGIISFRQTGHSSSLFTSSFLSTIWVTSCSRSLRSFDWSWAILAWIDPKLLSWAYFISSRSFSSCWIFVLRPCTSGHGIWLTGKQNTDV